MSAKPKGVALGIAVRHIVLAGLPASKIVPMKLFVLAHLYKFRLEKEGRGFKKVPDKPYAIADKTGTIWRFHKNSLSLVESFLNKERIDYTRHEVPIPRAAEVRFFKGNNQEPYENQPIVIDYLSGESPVSKLVELQTGKGKTFSTLYTLRNWNLRTAIIVPKMYLGIWETDVPITYKIDQSKREMMVVRTKTDLKNLIAYSATKEYKKNTKIVLFTTHVMAGYCQEFKDDYRSEEFACPPWELFDRLEIGIKIVDEVHKNFHMNYILDLWLDYQQSINLSATMDSSDTEQNKFYQLAFPKQERCPHIPYDKFIEVVDYRYYLGPQTKINSKQRGMGTYSHVAFEDSVMKNARYLKSYLTMLERVAEKEYFNGRDEGEKLLILCSTKLMARHIADHFKRRYPAEKVGTYLQEDNYDVLMEYTISVSTVMSAGTGVDIKGLFTNIMTQALGSRQSNEQCLGRTRKFNSKPDHRPRFVFLTCNDIPKHREYAARKKDYFADKAYSIITVDSNNVIE